MNDTASSPAPELQIGKRLLDEVLTPIKAAFVGKDEIVDLMGVWTLAVHGVAGVTIVETPNGYGADIDRVDVRLPASVASGGKVFARLTVTVPE